MKTTIKPRRRLLSFAVLLLLLLSATITVGAQETVTDDEVNAVAEDLFCPICENTPLDVCPTQACEDWREEIRGYLAAGMTKEEIHQEFANQYGDRVLAEPPRTGFSRWLWVLPVVAVVLGGLFFGRYLHGLRVDDNVVTAATETAPVPPQRVSPPTPAATEEDLDRFIARVEAELQED